MKLIVQASRDRRRGGMGFTKGQNGPFDESDNTEAGWHAINDDPYLTIKPFKEEPQSDDKDGSQAGSKPRTKRTPKPRGKSTAEKRAEKVAAKDASSADANTNNADPNNAGPNNAG